MPATHNKLKVFGDVSSQTPDVINAYTTAGAETPGFVQDTFIYVDLLNTALRNCSLVTYSLVDILNPSAAIMPGSEVGDGSTFGAEYTIKLALDKYIKEIKVDNAVQADKLSNSNAIGSATRPVYFNNQGVPVQCDNKIASDVAGIADYAESIRTKSNEFKSLQNALLDMIYPVGSIYMSSQNISPQTFLGGTWSQITGVFLVAAGNNTTTGLNFSANATGGNKDLIIPYHNHTLTKTAATLDISHNHTATVSNPTVTTGNQSNGHTHRFVQALTYLRSNKSRVTADDSSGGYFATGESITGKQTGDISTGHTHNVTTNVGVTVNTKSLTASITPGDYITVNYAGTSGNVTNANLPPYRAVYMWERTA